MDVDGAGYPRAWRCLLITAVALGVSWGLVTGPRGSVLGLSMTLGVAVAALVAVGQPDETAVATRIGRALPVLVEATTITMAVVGWADALGGASLPVLVLVALSAPPVVRRAGDRLQRLAPEWWFAGRRPLDQLSTRDLVAMWEHSAATVATTSDETARAVVVAARASYLDELERRDPVAFRRWISGDPLVAPDPGRFLLPPA